ncbi:MAG TPA: hypothetical protein DDW78_03835 [Treponema sp.]|nr:hypothetical protein [Treponema sp.]
MRRILSIFIALLLSAGLVSAASYSYKNNTYLKLAQEYSVKAQKAFDAGEYALAEEYALKAEENAALSDEFLKHMKNREDVDSLMATAKKRLDYARSIHADENYPIAFNAAADYYQRALEAYDKEDYENAADYARKVLMTLAQIKEMRILPQYYVVQPWETTRDCLWNIAKRPYVYNNPWLWENLYETNKDKFPRKNDPNLIVPGMKLEIPSISGEFRSGTYDPNEEYATYGED